MPVQVLDLIVIGIMLISALLAMVRGFTREVLSIAAWAAAAAAALLLYPQVVPFVKPYLTNALAQQLVAGGAVFLVTLVVVSFITIRISDMILDSRIGAVDRALGFLFGAARGLLLAVVAFIFYAWLVPPAAQPVWVKDAKSRPLLESSGTWLVSQLPNDPKSPFLQVFRTQQLLPAETEEPSPDAAPATPPAATPQPPPAPAPAP